MSTREKILTYGMVCSIALLGFVAGAVLTGRYAFADIPSNLKSDVLAYNNDIAYVSLDSVDHIVIYMNDGSKKIGSKAVSSKGSGSVETAVKPDVARESANALLVGEDNVSSPPMSEQAYKANDASSNRVDAGAAATKSRRSSSSGHSDGTNGSYSATDLNGIPLPPVKVTAATAATTSSSNTVAPAASGTTYVETAAPNITITNPTPVVNVTTQNPPANISTVNTSNSNYYYDYQTNTVVNANQMFDALIAAIKDNSDFAKAMASITLPSVSINTMTTNNGGNTGIIVQDSTSTTAVQVKDVKVNVDTTIKDSFNTDSLNTTMNNVGNTTATDVGNTDNSVTDNTTNIKSNNTTNTSLQDVANDKSKTDVDVQVQETVPEAPAPEAVQQTVPEAPVADTSTAPAADTSAATTADAGSGTP